MELEKPGKKCFLCFSEKKLSSHFGIAAYNAVKQKTNSKKSSLL